MQICCTLPSLVQKIRLLKVAAKMMAHELNVWLFTHHVGALCTVRAGSQFIQRLLS